MVTVAAPAQSSWHCSKRDKALENSALDQASLGRNLEEAAQDLIHYFERVAMFVRAGRRALNLPIVDLASATQQEDEDIEEVNKASEASGDETEPEGPDGMETA